MWASTGQIWWKTYGVQLVTGLRERRAAFELGLQERRGNSTADWVQANYDTQVLGSDFLTYGEPERTRWETMVLIK